MVIVESLLSVTYVVIKKVTLFEGNEKGSDILLFAGFLFLMFLFKFIMGFGYSVISSDKLINPYTISQDFFYHSENSVTESNDSTITISGNSVRNPMGTRM